MNRFLVATAIAAAPLTAVVAQAPMTASTYVMKAGASDQYEIQSSKLLLQSTTNPDLKSFANMMITDHTKSTAEVKSAAMAAGMHPAAPRLDAMGARNMAALRVTKGKLRDRLYMRQQKASHATALALHKNYAADGTVPQLKQAATAIAPVVQSHIDKLAAIS